MYVKLQGQFDMYNIAGQKLLSKELKNNVNSDTINASNLPSGIYYYRFILNNEQIGLGKIVIVN